MKANLLILTLVGSLIFNQCTHYQPDEIDYFGQVPPDSTPKIFALDIISITGTGQFGDYVTFSPDGDEMYHFTYQEGLKYSAKVDGVWSAPQDTVVYENFTPMFAPYKNLIYWANHNSPNVDNRTLKYSVKVDGVWSDTTNTHIEGANFVSATLDSTLYFVRYEGNDVSRMYTSKFNGEHHETPIPLPFPINDNNAVFRPNDPSISPDGSYIILYNDGGSMAYDVGAFITFKLDDDSWSFPKLILQNTVPVRAHAIVTTSPDGKYLFVMGTLDYSELDQYWMSTSILDDARNSNFAPYLKNNIPDQTNAIATLYNYTIPDSIFFDDDGNETLTLTATLSNGSDLPDSLTFNSGLNTFSGRLKVAGIYIIKVTATDTAGVSISDVFILTIEQ